MKRWVKEIENVLIISAESRDSDEILFFHAMRGLGFNPNTLSAHDLLRKIHGGELPSMEDVARARRLLQERDPKLRGKRWLQRHQKAGEFRYAVEEHVLGGGGERSAAP